MTYLSVWSTQYYYEEDSSEKFLFATLDKEMQELLVLTHQKSLEVYRNIYGNKLGDRIINMIGEIYTPREKPKVTSIVLDEMIEREKQNLKRILET